MNKTPPRQAHEGEWQWDATARRLSFDLAENSTLPELRGVWSVDGVSSLLDGFSRKRLQLGLEKGNIAVNCALRLADGRAFQIVGAFLDDVLAQGVLLSGVASPIGEGVGEGPGPALEPVYQPIVSVASGKVAGFEALARWNVAADPLQASKRYDDDGLASNMLIRAAETLDIWQQASGRRDLFVHVNLNGRDLEHSGLVSFVSALIDGYGFQPGMLRIELTEQAALRDAGEALRMAHALKDCGAGLILDDFGSGHSSFSWLADLPADGLKIDPDLINRLGEPRTDAILRAVSALARELGMTITAEGIEALWQLERLSGFGFDYAQGFALGHPLSREDALQRIAPPA